MFYLWSCEGLNIARTKGDCSWEGEVFEDTKLERRVGILFMSVRGFHRIPKGMSGQRDLRQRLELKELAFEGDAHWHVRESPGYQLQRPPTRKFVNS